MAIVLTPAVSSATSPYYQTRTYKSLLENICRVAGIEPDRLLSDDALAIRDYINSSMREGWEYYPWPHFMRAEETTVANIDNYKDKDLFAINELDPRLYRYPKPYTFSVDADGINIIPDLATTKTIYVYFRLFFYPFNGTEYSLTTTYSIGDMAYDSDTGDYYRSLANSNLGNGVSETTWWDRRQIPAFLFEYAKFSALSELREAEGQGNKSLRLKGDVTSATYTGKATKALSLEIDKWERQKNQQLRPQVRVRSGG